MITSDAAAAFDALAAQLTLAAQQLAEARMAQRLMVRANDPRRWRVAGLLWPSMTGG